ncbi:NUDIX domain-containing protein [Streptomyces sp. NPDC059853]|uniref:NUDIX hydrolase n=1 Tax=Streptomyces sp. NPDC059853 TaxID=3346973 RepID=UPI003657E475
MKGASDAEWYSPDIDRYVAASIVLREGKALMLRRKPDDFMGGFWELPSGKVDSGETIIEALERELREETDLVLVSLDGVLGFFDYLSGSGRKTRQVNFLVLADGAISLSEHDAAGWFDARSAAQLQITPETLKTVEEALLYN